MPDSHRCNNPLVFSSSIIASNRIFSCGRIQRILIPFHSTYDTSLLLSINLYIHNRMVSLAIVSDTVIVREIAMRNNNKVCKFRQGKRIKKCNSREDRWTLPFRIKTALR